MDEGLHPVGAAGAIEAEFERCFSETLSRTLDLDTWRSGEDLGQLYDRLTTEVEEALRQDRAVRDRVRSQVFPHLGTWEGAPPCAGVFRVSVEGIERTHRCLLFNGAVEACDGTQQTHETLPLTIFQIGVALVSYSGDQGTWTHRLFRRDLRTGPLDPTEVMLGVLQARQHRDGLNQPSGRDALSAIAREGIMAYAERAILLKRARAPWRMGHGTPAPVALLRGSGSVDLMVEGTRIVRELVLGHRRFVCVPSEPREALLLSLGLALNPLEYAIVDTLETRLRRMVEAGSYNAPASVDTTLDGHRLSPAEWIERFVSDVGSRVVVGIYRASAMAAPQIFYAHIDHAHEAAHVVLADSVLQEMRGFPTLIDLADATCRAFFGGESLRGVIQSAYAAAGAGLEYLSELDGRRRPQ